MANNLQDVYLPLFLLQIPQRILARYNFTQKDWMALLAALTEQELTIRNIGTTFVTLEIFCKVISVGKKLFGLDKLLCYYVADINPAHIGPVGLAVTTAPTVGGALDIWLDNASLLSPMLTVNRHTTIVDHYLDVSLNRDLGAISSDFMELAILLTHRLIRQTSDGRALVNISFNHDARLPLDFYVEHFGVQPLFSQPQTRMTFRSADLALANNNHAILAFNQAMNDVKILAHSATGQARLSQRVRQFLIDSAMRGEIYDQEQTAVILHVSVRTLARRLQEEGCNFRELLIEARIELAMQVLRQPGKRMKAASERAGFADLSSFCRAFRRYAQVSPKEYQERHAGSTDIR